MKAAEDGDVATLQRLIQENKIDVNTQGPYGFTWVS